MYFSFNFGLYFIQFGIACEEQSGVEVGWEFYLTEKIC